MRLARTARAAAAALSALAALLTPATAHAAAPAPAPMLQHAPGDTITLPVRDALAALTVQDESRTGYTRDKFKHWTDADRDSCNTRVIYMRRSGVEHNAVGAQRSYFLARYEAHRAQHSRPRCLEPAASGRRW